MKRFGLAHFRCRVSDFKLHIKNNNFSNESYVAGGSYMTNFSLLYASIRLGQGFFSFPFIFLPSLHILCSLLTLQNMLFFLYFFSLILMNRAHIIRNIDVNKPNRYPHRSVIRVERSRSEIDHMSRVPGNIGPNIFLKSCKLRSKCNLENENFLNK